jgi:tetratricopeptide (TPR) repeat protein
MKKIFLFTVGFFFVSSLSAQQQRADSLKNLLSTAKSDTALSSILLKLSSEYTSTQPEIALQYGYQALQLAEKTNYNTVKSRARISVGYILGYAGNYVKALQLFLEAKSIAEEYDDKDALSNCYHQLGNLFKWKKDFVAAAENYKKAIFYRELNGEEMFYTTPMNLGVVYLELNKMDSALMYAQKAYELTLKTKNAIYQYHVLANLGRIHQKLGNEALGRNYLRMAQDKANQAQSARSKCFTNLDLSAFFKEKGDLDSSIYYAKAVFYVPGSNNLKPLLFDAAQQLSILYADKNTDSAYKYLKLSSILKEELSGAEKTQQLQALRYEEELRQQQLASEKNKSKEEREHNLQYAAIALGLVTFCIFFFLLSHSVIANQKTISFLGILALLIVFEFLNLLLHPFLDRITNHQPVLMLAAMVCIAALLIPLHHKLEHWITHKMVEKNKKIRLAAAKKTIQQLEGDTIK